MSHHFDVALAAAGIAALVGTSSPLAAAEATVIELTQIPCQFIESENGVNHGFASTRKADCESINERTGADRLESAKTLTLAAGSYVFRVTNSNVPYDLGFWVRGASLIDRALLPSVSGGGLKTGMTKDYAIVLEPGEYVYSCPLNSTPDYRLVVTE